MSREQPAPAVESDLDYCHRAIDGVSRTFSLTVEALEEPMADYISVGYLLCRVADTVEDAEHVPTDHQRSLLRTFDAVLDPDAETTASAFREEVDEWLPPEPERNDDWAVVAQAPTVVATFESFGEPTRGAIRPPVREMIAGMETFLERYRDEPGIRIQTYDELERYSHYVAGTVGTLITNLVSDDRLSKERSRTLQHTAEGFGRLLQLVNIAKDVGADAVEEDNVYLPAAWLDDEGVTQSAIRSPDNEAAVGRVVERLVDRAHEYLDDGLRYLEAMPLRSGNTLAAWAVPYLLAVGTLRELDARPRDALTTEGVKVSRREVFAVLEVASSMTRGDLADLRRSIGRAPLHETQP
ncbi:MAG: phytoene/squalene synthase family protein [Halanaeroarchaeum sp.]